MGGFGLALELEGVAELEVGVGGAGGIGERAAIGGLGLGQPAGLFERVAVLHPDRRVLRVAVERLAIEPGGEAPQRRVAREIGAGDARAARAPGRGGLAERGARGRQGGRVWLGPAERVQRLARRRQRRVERERAQKGGTGLVAPCLRASGNGRAADARRHGAGRGRPRGDRRPRPGRGGRLPSARGRICTQIGARPGLRSSAAR